jgi:hypothetical protein
MNVYAGVKSLFLFVRGGLRGSAFLFAGVKSLILQGRGGLRFPPAPYGGSPLPARFALRLRSGLAARRLTDAAGVR